MVPALLIAALVALVLVALLLGRKRPHPNHEFIVSLCNAMLPADPDGDKAQASPKPAKGHDTTLIA